MHAVAAIDVGSNATRLAILTVSSTGVVLHAETRRFALRLGADVFATGRVGPERQAALVQIFIEIAELLRTGGIQAYRAVATSAMRDAQNGAALVAEVYHRSRIVVEIIAGVEESRLARAALVRALGTVQSDALLLDLGGGSLELERAGSRRGRSLPLGTVRLLEHFAALKAPLSGPALGVVRAAVVAEVRRYTKQVRPAPLAIGTGGNLDTLAQLLPAAGSGLPAIDLRALDGFALAAAPLDNEARVARFGVRPDRADLILPAVLVVLALVELFGIERLVVPGTGLREAMLHDLVAPADPGAAARRLVGASDLGPMARRGAKLGHELFAALGSLHGLWPSALQPLTTALYAWHFGAFLQADAAAAHAIYALRNVPGMELDARAAAVAEFCLQSLAGAAPLGPLPAEDTRPGHVLAGLLRLTLAMAPLARRTTALDVDVWSDPVRIAADLSAPLDPAAVAPLEAALGRRIAIR